MHNAVKTTRTSAVALLATALALGGAIGALTPTEASAITLAEARDRLSAIESDYERTSDELEGTERRLEELKGDIERTEGEVKEKEESLREKQRVLASMMSKEYKQGKGSFLDVIMSSQTIDAISVNLRYYNEANEADREVIADTKAAKEDLDRKKGELEGKRDDEQRAADDLRAKADDLSHQQDEAQALVDQLEEEERQRAIAAARARLAAALAARQAAQQARSEAGGEEGEPAPEGEDGEEAEPSYVSAGNTDVVSFALQFIGTPYVYGGSSPSGFDCSGFVSYVWGNYGVSLPRSTYSMISWAQANGTWTSDYSELGAGDPVFTHSGHVLMVVSPSSDWTSLSVIHSPRPGRSVCVENIYKCPIGGIRLS